MQEPCALPWADDPSGGHDSNDDDIRGVADRTGRDCHVDVRLTIRDLRERKMLIPQRSVL
ncbi:MAG: hypothetical protein ABFD66_06120 [Smithella sp.]